MPYLPLSHPDFEPVQIESGRRTYSISREGIVQRDAKLGTTTRLAWTDVAWLRLTKIQGKEGTLILVPRFSNSFSSLMGHIQDWLYEVNRPAWETTVAHWRKKRRNELKWMMVTVAVCVGILSTQWLVGFALLDTITPAASAMVIALVGSLGTLWKYDERIAPPRQLSSNR